MTKAYYFLWRRAGTDRNEFINYYEKPHLDLILANLPKHDDFRRNYPAWHRYNTPSLGLQPFDALTAITYGSPAKFDEAIGIFYTQPFNQAVTEDELRFLDRSRMKFVMVDEIIDQLPENEWRPAPAVGDHAKLIRLIKRPATLNATEFRKAYEATQVPAIRSTIINCIDYRRNYVRATDSHNFTTPELQGSLSESDMIACDLIEELCFASSADADAAVQALAVVGHHSPLLTDMQRTPGIICDQRLRSA
ncbi:unnamed protein product [Clonostachys rosea f. rosea IK726]|jgi:hypothetical protein|uniref:Uncharacterized protein n=1 Tax=Clonostachys rosea f. rosea IK726 TaxID=1349383 RepID=A0ACA9TZC0_BIOOC|nr:unnamed protein product [Clonostachys rosea f. rosea IK726]